MRCETEFKEVKYVIELYNDELKHILNCITEYMPKTKKDKILNNKIYGEFARLYLKENKILITGWL